MKQEVAVSVVQCARCGVVVAAVTAVCEDCHFAYCSAHTECGEHSCEDVCYDCEDDFEEYFWGAPLFG